MGLLVVGFFPAVATILATRGPEGTETQLVRLAAVFWLVVACYAFLQITFHCGFMLF